MSDEKYNPSTDIEQSGVRFVSSEPSAEAIDFNCERIAAAVGSFGVKKFSAENADDLLDELFDGDDFPQPFIDMVIDHEKDIFKRNSNIAVIEFLFNATFTLLFERAESFNSNMDKLSIVLTRQDDNFSELNIRLLCLLFNLIPNGNAKKRAMVMQRLLNLGCKSKNYLAKLFRGRLNGLEVWIENDWSNVLSISDKKKLYQSASLVAKKAADAEQSQTFLIKYLKLFNNDDDDNKSSINDDVINEASQAVIAAISSKTFNTKIVMELTKSHIVNNVMSKNKKFVKLYKLLNIVYCGNVTDFELFYKENKQYTDELGLNYEELMKKMRLLTLCSLGNINKTNHSFDELKEKLHLNDQNQVEELIIYAVTEKLLYAKIDYSKKEVDITRAKQRIFDNKSSWNILAHKLSLWRQNTNTVLQIIHNAGLNRWRQQYMKDTQKQAAVMQ